MNYFKIVFGVFIALVITTISLGSFEVIDQGEAGVKLRNGKAVESLTPGLTWKAPIFEGVKTLSTRTEKVTYKTAAYSKDIQPADVIITVNYHLDPTKAIEVYSKYQSLEGAVDRVVTPRVMDSSKATFGQFTAAESIQNRQKVSIDIAAAITQSMANSGLIIDAVQIENIDFSDSFEQSVENRMKAEIEVETEEQNYAKEKWIAEQARAKAKAVADAKFYDAEAKAKGIELIGKAEAASIEARGKALRANPDLVKLITAETWDGKLPQTMVPNGSVPLVDLK